MIGWHTRLWAEYPDQRYFNAPAMSSFLQGVTGRTVVEIGGWRGEAAATFLPHIEQITRWRNYEVCREAVNRPICTDHRYEAINRACYDLCNAEIGILSHVLEHMSNGQARHLLATAGVSWLYIDCPMPPAETPKWQNATAFHVLTMRWPGIKKAVREAEFRPMGRFDHECRWYKR